MRERLEKESRRNTLKRGRGGTLDIEFLIAHLQLKHAAAIPALKQPDLWEALNVLREHRIVDDHDFDTISGAYAFLRQVVNRVQILDGNSSHELPEGPAREVFAKRMGYRSSGGFNALDQLNEELTWHQNSARAMYDNYVV
jgi:glutamate-ammonia-ligase adenylyltransferase